jgi:adenine specific DNA methylase Mod
MNLNRKSKFKINKEVVSCDLGEETAILNMKDGVYYGLNPVGTTIWKHIQNKESIGKITDKILEEYSIDEETCYADLIELVENLLEKGLITIL